MHNASPPRCCTQDGHIALAQEKFAFAMLATKAMLPKGEPGAGGDPMGGLFAGMMQTEQVPERLRDVVRLSCEGS
jgi:hypothetical protein